MLRSETKSKSEELSRAARFGVSCILVLSHDIVREEQREAQVEVGVPCASHCAALSFCQA
jgi:hypothetical protein